jgi:hypothetical protein
MTTASYTHTTLAQMKTLLAQRLSDTAKVFYIDAELGAYIIESLRTFGILSGFFSDRVAFNTTAGQAFYDLTSVISGLLGFNVTDTSLVAQIQRHFLELSTGTTWSTVAGQTDQFVLADATAALQQRRNDFLLKTGCVVGYTASVPVGAPTISQVLLPDTVIDVRRLDWLKTGLYSLVRRRDEWAANAWNPGWQAGSASPPTSYSAILTNPVQVQFIPPATSAPTAVGMLAVSSGPALNPAAGVLMSVPDDLTPWVKWGAMCDMLGKDGQARDPERAEYCEQRYQEGLQVAAALCSVEQALIGTGNLWLSAQIELDDYGAGWQNTAGQPTRGALSGWNMLALSPVPDAAYTVTLDLIPNTPVPAIDADFVQVGREHIDIILDYAEHLAAFKMGGQEFKATMPHYKRLMQMAVNNNHRLAAIANNLRVLRQEPGREENFNPRKTEEAA